MSRWEPFTDEELIVILDEMLTDDGIRYGVSEDDEPLYSLVQGIRAELKRRGKEDV